jgi:hypothetical protein
MGLLIWLGAYFQALTLRHTFRPLPGHWVPYLVPLGCPTAPKQPEKTIFWLFRTISPTRMGLLIWLGAYFQARTLGHTTRLLAGHLVPFLVRLGMPKCPQTVLRTYCLVVLDHFS